MVLGGPVENVLIQVYTDLSLKGEVVRRTCFTMQAAMLLLVTTILQTNSHDQWPTEASLNGQDFFFPPLWLEPRYGPTLVNSGIFAATQPSPSERMIG